MGGGLMQLVAYGAQDVYLTGNPEITFFKIVYRRHTNFSCESIENQFSGSADFNRTASCPIVRNADLVNKMYLRVTVEGTRTSGTGRWAFVTKLGHALINNVELNIGGSKIDRHYGDWFNVKYALMRESKHDRGYDKMIGNTAENTELADVASRTVSMHVPLLFSNCLHDGLALPLISLQYHDTRLEFQFRRASDVVVTEGDAVVSASFTSADVLTDYIYLDNIERRKFAQASHEYLIEQVQHSGNESVTSSRHNVRLNSYNHPTKAIFFALKLGKYTSGESFLAYHPSDAAKMREEATKRLILANANKGSSDDLVETDGDGTILVNNAASAFPSGLSAVCLSHGAAPTAAAPIEYEGSADVDNVQLIGGLMTKALMSTSISDLVSGNYIRSDRATACPTTGRSGYDVTVRQFDNYGLNLDRSDNPVSEVLLQLNGHDRFSQRSGDYFNYVQPYQHFKDTPADGVNVYSFGLDPCKHQPSGSLNLSRIDEPVLSLWLNGSETFGNSTNVFVFVHSYNVLRIMSGMGGLAYSN